MLLVCNDVFLVSVSNMLVQLSPGETKSTPPDSTCRISIRFPYTNLPLKVGVSCESWESFYIIHLGGFDGSKQTTKKTSTKMKMCRHRSCERCQGSLAERSETSVLGLCIDSSYR